MSPMNSSTSMSESPRTCTRATTQDNAATTVMSGTEPCSTAPTVSPAVKRHAITLRLELTLRTMIVLPRVLMLLNRLGVTLMSVSSAANQAHLAVQANPAMAHRVAPQLRKLVDVVSVHEDRPTTSHDTPAALETVVEGK